MATHAIQPIVPASLDKIKRGTLRILEANSSTYKKGALLIITSNRVAEASADPTGVYAIAAQDGQNGTDKYTEVWRVNAGDLFEGSLEGTSAASSIVNNVGTVKDAGGYWKLDAAETEDIATIERVAPNSEVGDTNARVYFTFDAANVLNG